MWEVLQDEESHKGLDGALKREMNALTSNMISACVPDNLVRLLCPHMQVAQGEYLIKATAFFLTVDEISIQPHANNDLVWC